MTDLNSQLATLHALRASVSDREQGAALDGLIASLEARVAGRRHTQVVDGGADVGVAVAGDVYGDIYLSGRRGRSAAQELRGYLQRLVWRYSRLPLQGVSEQKVAGDLLAIHLERVYTQLATTTLVEREVYAGDPLRRFGAETVFKAHTGADLMPSEQRQMVHIEASEWQWEHYFDSRQALPHPATDPVPAAPGDREFALDMLSPEILAEFASFASRLTFFGPQLVTEAIAAHRHLVLLGPPGSGKSTAIRYLALTLAEAELNPRIDLAARLEGWAALGDQGRLLPVFQPLLPFARQLAAQSGPTSADALWTYIAERLEPKGAYTGLAAAIHEEVEAGRVLLLLDGLDEVASTASRRQVIQAVQEFVDTNPGCRVVVTCRVRAYEGPQNQEWQLPGWPTATLADWTFGQMAHFIAAWYADAAQASRMPAARRDDRIATLRRAVDTRQDLQRLGVRPLLLTIMALVHLNDGRLPEDRVSLYGRCLDILLAQWEIAGKEETAYGTLMEYIGLPDVDVKSLHPLLMRAAFHAHEASSPGSPGQFGRAQLRELVAQALAEHKHPNPWEGARKFLEYTDVRAGLLQASDAGDAYMFPHQTFQEYLAGLELVSGVDFVQRIMERRHDDRWLVPIMLGIGHLVSKRALYMPFTLLSELLHVAGRTPEQEQRDLLFAAEIAEDAQWERLERGGGAFRQLRQDLALALVEIVKRTILPIDDRVRAGHYLGQLGDPRPGVCDLQVPMVPFVGGNFYIGNTWGERTRLHETVPSHWLAGTANNQKVFVASFELAHYPVTNAQFKEFMIDGGYDPKQPWWDEAGAHWLARTGVSAPRSWDQARFGQQQPNHPVVDITWYEAMAFCRWLTQHPAHNPQGYLYRLPSEAEWEYAARGAARRSYPWGAEVPDYERANFGGHYKGTTAVGCFPQGMTPDEVYDLGGNVWEWTRSAYCNYPYDPADGRESEANPAERLFTVRGGGWANLAADLHASFRDRSPPDNHYYGLGFRLARQSKA